MARDFTLIEGFDSIEAAQEKINYLFPNIGVECFDIYKVQDMYYGVTISGTDIQIVVSKAFVRCRMPNCCGLIETDKLEPQKWKWNGIYGGSSRWNEGINIDARSELGSEIQVYSGKNTGGPRRKHWANNTEVLLNCLFSDKTRNDDNATS